MNASTPDARTPDPQDPAAWRARRSEDARARAEVLARREQQEQAQARELLAGFVRDALAAGLDPEPLRANAGDRSRGQRTDVVGWYLRRNRTLGVGSDGELYRLTAPAGLVERLRGVRVTALDPPLVVGRGGRDGESVPLVDLLAARLRHGAPWP